MAVCLGLALAHTAGVDFETLVRERVTGPLGMRDTVITLDEDQLSRVAPGRNEGEPTAPGRCQGSRAPARFARRWPTSSCSFVRRCISRRQGPLGTSPPRSRFRTRERTKGGRLAPAMRVGLGWLLLPIGRQKLDTLWHKRGDRRLPELHRLGSRDPHGRRRVVTQHPQVDPVGTRVLLDLAPTGGQGE